MLSEVFAIFENKTCRQCVQALGTLQQLNTDEPSNDLFYRFVISGLRTSTTYSRETIMNRDQQRLAAEQKKEAQELEEEEAEKEEGPFTGVETIGSTGLGSRCPAPG